MAGHDQLAVGRAALAAGRWQTAAEAFAGALDDDGESADALDGLGQARWWTQRVAEGIQLRTRAYAAFCRSRKWGQAAHVAVWLAREHHSLYHNDAVASGWLSRAAAAAGRAPSSSASGWVELAQAELSAGPVPAAAHATSALRIARRCNDADLEIVALSRLGLVLAARGQVEESLRLLDEAMVAATAGEGRDPRTVGDACCALVAVAELLGDTEHLASWSSAVEHYRAVYQDSRLDDVDGHATLSAFCGACCGGVFMVTGRLDEAEAELVAAIRALEATQMHSRCVHPVTQLAELWSLQNRSDQARHLLAGYEDLPETVRPLALLDLAAGDPGQARARLRRRIGELTGQDVVALPLWVLTVDAELALGDVTAAGDAAAHVERIAALTGSPRHEAEALFARGKVAAATAGHPAAQLLTAAARRFSEVGLAVPACRARLALARVLAGSDRGAAVSEARAALVAFERLGASRYADEAAAFLRELGVRGRTGPKDIGVLTRREVEVLGLVSQGLSNAEIAERLFISVKTAGHHVSSILAKLQLRSRTEAAAFAALSMASNPAGKIGRAPHPLSGHRRDAGTAV